MPSNRFRHASLLATLSLLWTFAASAQEQPAATGDAPVVVDTADHAVALDEPAVSERTGEDTPGAIVTDDDKNLTDDDKNDSKGIVDDGLSEVVRLQKELLESQRALLDTKDKLDVTRAKLEEEKARGEPAQTKTHSEIHPEIDANAINVLVDGERRASKLYSFNLSLTALTRNISAGLSLKYLWALQTDFTADILLTPLINGLALDDLDSVRFTAAQTVGWRLSLTELKFLPRNVQKDASPWPDFIFGAGAWGLLEADHLAQAFRLGDAGLFLAATFGPFVALSFQDVTLSLAYRPLSFAAFYLDGKWDSRPFAIGNPVLDVSITWRLPI